MRGSPGRPLCTGETGRVSLIDEASTGSQIGIRSGSWRRRRARSSATTIHSAMNPRLCSGSAGMPPDPRPHIAGTFVNWNIVGDILMATGIVGIVASVLLARSAGRQTTTTAPSIPEV